MTTLDAGVVEAEPESHIVRMWIDHMELHILSNDSHIVRLCQSVRQSRVHCACAPPPCAWGAAASDVAFVRVAATTVTNFSLIVCDRNYDAKSAVIG